MGSRAVLEDPGWQSWGTVLCGPRSVLGEFERRPREWGESGRFGRLQGGRLAILLGSMVVLEGPVGVLGLEVSGSGLGRSWEAILAGFGGRSWAVGSSWAFWSD